MMRRTMLCCAAALFVTGCGSPAATSTGDATATPKAESSAPRIQIDGPSYASVRELSQAADVVAIGRVEARVSTTTEGALSGGTRAGLPIAIYSVAVEKALKGDPAKQISVTRIDTDQVTTEAVTPFTAGQDVILFLRQVQGTTYSVVGLDQGIFDASATDSWLSRGGAIPEQTTAAIEAGVT